MPDLTTSIELRNILIRNRSIWSSISQMEVENLRPSDLTALSQLNEKVLGYLGPAPNELRAEWESINKRLIDWANFGQINQKSCLCALILTGAAISRADIPIRNDLDPSILEARRKYLESPVPDPGTGEGPVSEASLKTIFSSDPNAEIITQSVNFHNKLFSKNKPLLKQKVKELLSDPSKVMRIGSALSKLNLNSLKVEAAEHLFKNKRYEATGEPRQGNNVTDDEKFKVSVPKSFILSSDYFRCIRQNEEGSDEIFWVGFMTYIENVQEIFELIDKAVKTNRLLELNISKYVKFATRRHKTSIINCNSADGNKHWNSTFDFGSLRLYNGFFPWAFDGQCIEDDNQEYQVVSEVFDEIGDAAGLISQGALMVAAVSGPTVVAAGATLVSAAAGVVSLCADISQGVVDIANFFDDNDLIGDVTINGNGDYIGAPELHNHSEEYSTTGAYSGGYYKLNCIQTFTGSEKVKRAWTCYNEIKHGRTDTHSGILGMGNSGDESYSIKFSTPMTILNGYGVDLRSSRKYSHAEWKSPPKLQSNKITAKGVVHWGLTFNHTIKYQPFVMGTKIIQLL